MKQQTYLLNLCLHCRRHGREWIYDVFEHYWQEEIRNVFPHVVRIGATVYEFILILEISSFVGIDSLSE